jgi:hypothetical protein
MSANYQAVKIVNQTRVTRFRARNSQVGSSPPVNAAEFPHLLAMESPQRHPIEAGQQFLESLPNGLALFDETIDGHLLICDCRFAIADLASLVI